MPAGLNPKRQRFVEEYLVDFNGTQAAIRAGYAPKAAKVQAAQLLTIPNVRAAVEAGRAKAAESCGWDEQRVIDLLGEIASDVETHPGARVSAVQLIGKHIGMFQEKPQAIATATAAVVIRTTRDLRGS